MGPATRYAFVVVFVLCCALQPWCVGAQTTTKKSLRSTISGKVTIKGKPGSGIIVGVRPADMNYPFQAAYKGTTDQDGNYRILDVPTGTYEVVPASPAYVSSEVNNQRGKVLVLGEGENIDNINFSLVRGGVITGKITVQLSSSKSVFIVLTLSTNRRHSAARYILRRASLQMTAVSTACLESLPGATR
jgi:hypothetical protein